MLTPLSILSLDQGPMWTEAAAARTTSRLARLRHRLAPLGHAALAALAAARRFALRRGLRAG
jgi:hypothetical protein